jgi:NAD(P)H-dependent flavin oxidoreductase YrpB (nitropropane dioxygenase family)
MLKTAREAVKSGIPVIVDGGIYQKDQVNALLGMGALAVGLGGALWGVKPNM